jgi:hypothetical protein
LASQVAHRAGATSSAGDHPLCTGLGRLGFVVMRHV